MSFTDPHRSAMVQNQLVLATDALMRAQSPLLYIGVVKTLYLQVYNPD